jgi:hypothetical protein
VNVQRKQRGLGNKCGSRLLQTEEQNRGIRRFYLCLGHCEPESERKQKWAGA